jgi:hypothetical protein
VQIPRTSLHEVRNVFFSPHIHDCANLLSSRLLSKNVIIRIYKTIILPVVLYGCETWSLILREEHRLRLFENGMCIMRSFITCTLLQV